MPILFIVGIGLQVLCAIHVMRTGRPTQWLFLIMLLPVAGCLAYLVLEILPEMRHSRAARRIGEDIGAVINPDRELRKLTRQAVQADTVQNKFDLAKECLNRGRYGDAQTLLEQCLTGIHADDPRIMMALAKARFGLEDFAGCADTLDRLRAANPDFQSADGHMLYAQAKERQGKKDDALTEYAALARYYPGEEARCRHALLLHETGRHDEAAAVFQQVVTSVETGSKSYFRAQRDWYDLARQHIGG